MIPGLALGKTKMETLCGALLDYANPTVESIDLETILRVLPRTPRFMGHTKQKISVAQHSVLTWELATDYCRYLADWELDRRRNLQLLALCHDFSDAYMGDLARGLKTLCPDFCAIEAKIQGLIWEKWSITTHDSEAMACLEYCDNLALAIEAKQGVHSRGLLWGLPRVIGIPTLVVLGEDSSEQALREACGLMRIQ